MNTHSNTIIPIRPALNSSAQILDNFIVNAATKYACMDQSPLSTGIKDKQLEEWHRFFLRVFKNRLLYYEEFLCFGAQKAQNMIDVIQTSLDVEWIDGQFKSILEIALLRLAQVYQLYPKKILLKDVLHHNALLAFHNLAVRGTHHGKVVSVKVSGSRLESSLFRQHVLIWTRLRHENVLPVYGMCIIARYDNFGQYNGAGIVSPFMKNSNIIDFLKENTVADRKSLILDVALGMSYLHDSGVVHGRIHGKNILITHDPLRACLSDFGLAVLPVDSGAAPFLAPELGVSGLPCPTRTTASDVFAFSTASYEIFTSSKPEFIPWSNPSKPDDSEIDEVTWLILLGAWQRDPKMRSSAGQIVEELEKIIKSREQRTDQLKSVLKIIFKESEYYRQFLSCAEADAQEVLDTVQSLLDTSNLPLEDRNQLIVAMRRLSEQTELYPSRFSLNCPLSKPEEEPIAWGAFADVYKAQVHPDHDICVKVIRVPGPLQENLTKAYAREVINWGQLSHPNILPFYGLSRLGSRLCLVSRWAKNGNLSAYLQTDPNASRVLLCLDTAVGVEYLHKNDIVHGDLKGVNVLIDSAGRACLGDFGLSSVTDPQILKWTSQSTEASSGGTARWRAPELLDPENENKKVYNSKESDVYAWASICYEAFTGLWPFHEINSDLSVMHAISTGKKPTRPQKADPIWSRHDLNDRIWKLMEDCWSFDPSDRPTMTVIISRLEADKPIDSRPSGDWEERAPVRFRMAHSHNTRSPKDLSSLWDRLEGLLSRIVPAAFERGTVVV